MVLYASTYLKQLKDVQRANQFMNTEIEDIEVDRVMNIISIKNREPVPLRSLRIVLVRPNNIKGKC